MIYDIMDTTTISTYDVDGDNDNNNSMMII